MVREVALALILGGSTGSSLLNPIPVLQNLMTPCFLFCAWTDDNGTAVYCNEAATLWCCHKFSAWV